MRKKLLMLLLVLCTGINLYACGSKGSEIATNNEKPQTETIEDEESNVEGVTEEENGIEDDSNKESSVEDDIEDTHIDDIPKSETDTKAYHKQEIENSTETVDKDSQYGENKPSGLIIATEDYKSNSDFYISISSLNPTTSEQHLINTFSLQVLRGAGEYMDLLPNNNSYHYNLEPGIYANYKEWFSEDYSKIAITRRMNNNGESHAGWLNGNGIFFDVTGKLGLNSHGDFAESASYEAVGFTEDGYFAFYGGTEDSSEYYYVPISNISKDKIVEGSPFPNSQPSEDHNWYNWFYEDRYITDWIDDHTFIRNTGKRFTDGSSVIVDLKTNENREYIPGDSRENWNGVLSPDGSQIAFMSQTRRGDELPSIYITSLSGEGEPIKVDSDIEFTRSYTYYTGRSMNDYDLEYLNFLIDWK